MKRIRVLFAVGSLGGGGSERQTIYLLRGLDRERFDPVLYLLERRGELTDEAPSDVPSFAFSDDFVPPRFNWPGRIRAAQVAHVRKILRRERIDVVCERGIVTTLAVAPAAKAEGVPRIATFAAEPNFDLADQAKRFRFFKKRLLKRAYAEASALVALTGDVADRAAALYSLDRERIRVIFNPVDCERIDRLANAEPAPIDEDGNFHVVAAARLKAEKGFGHLIRAADELVHRRGRDRLRVRILGQGPEEANLRKLIEELGLERHVRLEGFVANPFAWFRAADLFCMPSETEGMPNVLLEAIACRTPVLSTDCVSGPRDILDGGRYGRLVAPGDWKALADGIDDAMANREAWQATVEPARQRVESEFSIPATTRKYEELFEAAAARGDARTASVSRLPETGKDG